VPVFTLHCGESTVVVKPCQRKDGRDALRLQDNGAQTPPPQKGAKSSPDATSSRENYGTTPPSLDRKKIFRDYDATAR